MRSARPQGRLAVAPEEAAAPRSDATTVILIRDLAVRTVIGVYESERQAPRTLRMDLDIEIEAPRAAHSDELGDTVDYAAIVEDLRRELAHKKYRLLEALADFVIERLVERFGARRVAVQVMKVGIRPGVGGVGVRIARRAEAPPPARPARPAPPVALHRD